MAGRLALPRRLIAALGGLALLASVSMAGCEWPEGTRFVDHVFDEVDITRDVVYRSTTDYTGQPVDLRLNVYQPRGDTRAERPVVMWMFGGAWIFGDRNQMEAYAIDSARRGYVAVTIDYRIRFLQWLDTAGTLAAAMDAYDDAVAAVAWLKDHAAQFRMDPDAIVAGGVSAGAVEALNLLYIHDRGPTTSPIAGAISISGVAFVSPSPGDPPAIMHQGTADTTVAYAAGKRTCDDAVRVGNVCEWLPYEGGDHYIVYWYASQIMETSARLVFERVLWPQGYREETATGPR
jgi:acetyl esterase/lipase